MSDNSLTSAINLGVQSAKGSAATAYKTSLALSSGANPDFDTREPKLEHPAPSARATKVKIPQQRVGYLEKIEAGFLLRPRFIGTVLRGAGFGVASVNNTTYYTHTFTLANRSAAAWLTALILDTDDAGNTFERKITDVRIDKLSVKGGVDEIMCDLTGVGLVEGDASGSETKVAEVPVEISPASGSATITIAGNTVASPIRGSELEIASDVDDTDRVLFSAARNSLPQKSIGITGTLKDIDFDYNTYEYYRRIVRGSLVATAPTLTAALGTLTYTFNSLSNISGAAVPYSLQVTVPSLYWELTEAKKAQDNLVRVDAKWTMVDDSATPITIVLKNDQTAY